MNVPVTDRPRVAAKDRLLGAFVARHPHLMRRLGDWETRALAAEIEAISVRRPVYVCGLARAGTTILLELLAAAPEFTTHHYSDYPLLWTPYWWNWLHARLPLPAPIPIERAHRDRIAVSTRSPEAFEEMLWMHFFPARHDPQVDQVLGGNVENTAFDAFYTRHIRKLLAVRNASRYLAKGNYNLTRIGYLQRLFPDARFIIAVREPIAHVASLVKQDRLFSAWASADPAIARHLARSGHFEFGPHKTAVNTANAEQARAIQACFASGDPVRGYALQWAASYGWLRRTLDADAGLAAACEIVPYDRLCAEPQAVLARVYAHAGIDSRQAARLIGANAARLAVPSYYAAGFDPAEQAVIEQATAQVWRELRI